MDFPVTWLILTELNLNPLKVPICSPVCSVFRPLILITLLMCLLQCSGSVFIKKFMIQILTTKVRNVTEQAVENNITVDDLDYALPLIILSVRLAVIFLMAFLVKKLRVRFLYFLSLFSALILLVCLALASDPAQLGLSPSDTTVKWIKTVIICLHVSVIQLGLNTLPQLLEITIFPTSCMAAMKGIMRAIFSITMVVFIFLFKTLEYSQAFYLMAAVLLVSSPLLWLYVPEIRNIGSDLAVEFFLPSQTIFYFFPPKSTRNQRNEEARAFIRREVSQEVEIEENSRKYPTVKFSDELSELAEIGSGETLSQKMRERTQFVSNIMSQGNPLIANPSEQRVLIGKGPVELNSKMLKEGNIFLFDDLLVVSTRIIDQRRYCREICFNREKLTIAKSGEMITLSDDGGKHLEIRFADKELASLWEQYLSYKAE